MSAGSEPGGAAINRVHEGFYLDSVALMRMAMELETLVEVETAALMIGTPANLEILAAAGLLTAAGEEATPRDLIVAIKMAADFQSEDAGAAVLERAGALLRQPSAGTGQATQWRPKMLRSAVKSLPGANLALISLPGAYAAGEARKAMEAGLHVLIFSDNVPLAEEAALKAEARRRGLLVMGPDCGTAIINGVAVAFANKVSRGDIGIVSASGTGLQEVSSLLTRMGGGISHGIGTGGRDLHEAVGGITTLMAIDTLDSDPATSHIVIISKPPAPSVARMVVERVAQSQKPFTICLLGSDPLPLPPNARQAFTLQQTAEFALGEAMPSWQPSKGASAPETPSRAGWLRGLFTGGTLCAEAQTILLRAGLPVLTNALVPGLTAQSNGSSEAHILLDLGADEYTLGRLHPMIDPKPREAMFRQALESPQVAVVMLDVVLGQGAHPNPAGGLADIVSEAGPDRPHVVASITGTAGDPQGWAEQGEMLSQAGVLVAPSNAAAATLALSLLKGE